MVQPSAQNDEIGARLVLPSLLSDVTGATGVPKYRIFGSIVRLVEAMSAPAHAPSENERGIAELQDSGRLLLAGRRLVCPVASTARCVAHSFGFSGHRECRRAVRLRQLLAHE